MILKRAEYPIVRKERIGGTSREEKEEKTNLGMQRETSKTQTKLYIRNGGELKSHMAEHRLIETC